MWNPAGQRKWNQNGKDPSTSKIQKGPPIAYEIWTELSNPRLSTEIDSSSTMAERLSRLALMLKCQLSEAILLHQTEQIIRGWGPTPENEAVSLTIDDLFRTYQEVDPKSKNWEENYDRVIFKMKDQIFNPLLRKYYDYGKKLTEANKKPHWTKSDQRTATFVFLYFEGNPEAISLVKKVTTSQIGKLNNNERDILLKPRLEASGRVADQRPTSLEADDLRYQDATSDSDDALFTIAPPSKKPRHASKPPATDLASQLFACDFEYHTFADDSTVSLEPAQDPIPLNRKRKTV